MTAPVRPPTRDDDRSLGELVFDVSERVSTLVREEVELAKAEVSEKVSSLLRGSVVGIAAGVFAFLGLILLMHSIAWLLNDYLFGDHFWLGFLVEAVLFFCVAAAAGMIAYRAVQKGSPPTPDLAIEEGKRIRQTLESATTPAASEPSAPAAGGTPSPPPAPSTAASEAPAPPSGAPPAPPTPPPGSSTPPEGDGPEPGRPPS